MDGSGSCAYAYDTPPQGGSCRWLPRASRCTARTCALNNTQGGRPIAGNETKGACRRPSRRGEKLDGAPLGEKLDCRPLQCKDKLILSLFIASAEGIRSPIFSAPGLGPRPTRMHAPTHARKWRCASADGSGAKTDGLGSGRGGRQRTVATVCSARACRASGSSAPIQTLPADVFALLPSKPGQASRARPHAAASPLRAGTLT